MKQLYHGRGKHIAHMTSLVSAFAWKAPMKMQRMEMMTQDRENGASSCTNFTPTATTKVSSRMAHVPYSRKLFHGLVWMSPNMAKEGAMYCWKQEWVIRWSHECSSSRSLMQGKGTHQKNFDGTQQVKVCGKGVGQVEADANSTSTLRAQVPGDHEVWAASCNG